MNHDYRRSFGDHFGAIALVLVLVFPALAEAPKPMTEADKLATALMQIQVYDTELQVYGYRASEEISNAKLTQLERAKLKATQEYAAHVAALRKKYGWAEACAPNTRGEVECR